jgi:ankyrin repeat protein
MAIAFGVPICLIAAAVVLVAIDYRQATLDRDLIAAIESDKSEVALKLLRQGADVNASKGAATNRSTPLSLLQDLWRRIRGQPVARQPSGPTALLLAVETDETEVVEELLRHRPRDLHPRDKSGSTLVGKALQNDDNRIVQALYQAGAYEKEDLYWLLSWAVGRSDEVLTAEFLARGAPINGTDPNACQTPFYVAAEARDWSMMKYLLKRGANVNGGGDGLDYASALSYAAERNDFEMVRFLLAHGAQVNKEVRFGNALTKAAEAGNVEMVRLLLRHKADPSIGDYHNDLSVLIAINNKTKVLKLLLTAGANPNVDAWGGKSLLGIAASLGNLEAVTAVLSAGAKVNRASSHGGTTALMDAAASGRLPIVRLLLDRGARVNQHAKDSSAEGVLDGDTALNLAIRNGHRELAKLLRRRGGRRSAELR